MDEERVGVGLLDAGQGYGTLSESSASFNPTLNTNLDENGTLNSFNNQPSFEEAREPLVQPSLEPTTMGETPDQILNSFGALNPYILMIFCLMSIVWGLTAMPMMVSAFLLGDVCTNTTSCTPTHGSISEEFDLTGARAKFADFTTMSFLLGNALGANPISWFSDTRGRRAGLILSLALFGLFGLLATFATNVYVFMILRLCQGLLFPGCGVLNWVHAYESSPMSLRKYAALVFGLNWVVGYCLLAPIAYLLPHWRHLMIAASLPSLVYAILMFFVLPESFHFMVSMEKRADLDRWLKNANKVSRNPRLDLTADTIINAHQKTQLHTTENRPTRGVFSELLKKRVLLVYTLILGYLWTCDSFVYYGISLISTLLSGAGSKYWSYALTGLVEIPSYICSPFLLDLLGRRLFVSLCHFLTAGAFLGLMFVEDPRFSLVLWLTGKFGISCAFTALFVYASEVFPTVIRSSCIGLCVILARVGGLFAPLTRLMTTINPNLPNIFFTVSAAIGGAVTLMLPETKDKELPDSVNEVEIRE